MKKDGLHEYVPAVKLYKPTGKDGLWPSDIAAYYDRLDAERGFPKAKLILGYKRGKVASDYEEIPLTESSPTSV